MGTRRKLDQYYTDEHALDALERKIARLPQPGETVVDPCVGTGVIARRMQARGAIVITGDLDPAHVPDVVGDAREAQTWEYFDALARSRANRHEASFAIDWVVSNFPFSVGFEILVRALPYARYGVINLCRLSFLEPTGNTRRPNQSRDRGPWLADHAPADVLVLPRTSFTGDGKTDSVTCAWMRWAGVVGAPGQGVQIVAKQQNRAILPDPETEVVGA